VVFAGLPGSGKSRLAETVGQRLTIPVFAKDWLEGVLMQCGITHAFDRLGKRQLVLGQSVILVSVASTASIRNIWRALASEYEAHWRVIECICSDERLHRSRLDGRQRHIPNWPELEWLDVERVKANYAGWDEERFIIDAVQPFQTNLEIVLSYLAV